MAKPPVKGAAHGKKQRVVPPEEMRFTVRQQRFIEEYVIDLNATQAAIRAGYSPRGAKQSAMQIMRRPHVQAEIQRRMNERSQETGITANYVLLTIKETVERCRQAEPVFDKKGERVYVETPSGELAPAFTFDASGVLKGCELLGKHLKLFTEKTEHTGKDGGPIQHEHSVTESRLDKLMGKHAATAE